MTKPITITHLGVFGMHRDSRWLSFLDNGLNVTHPMGIWGVKRAGGLDLLRGPCLSVPERRWRITTCTCPLVSL